MATNIAVPLTPKSNIAIFLSSLVQDEQDALIESQEETPRDDFTEWSDVSSLTSCAWPASSLAESIVSLDNRTEGNKNAIEIATYAEIADLWDDECRDTRLIHARAGHTRHAKKSQRRYRNLGLPSNIADAYCHEQVIERKPWKLTISLQVIFRRRFASIVSRNLKGRPGERWRMTWKWEILHQSQPKREIGSNMYWSSRNLYLWWIFVPPAL